MREPSVSDNIWIRARLLPYSVGASTAAGAAIILGIAMENLTQVTLGDILPVVKVLGIAAVAGPVFCALLSRSLVVFFPIGMFLFFDYGAIEAGIVGTGLSALDAPTMAMLVTVLLLGVSFLLIRRLDARAVQRATLAIMAVLAVIAGIVSLPVLLLPTPVSIEEGLPAPAGFPTPDQLPDVLYIVPDRYASAETLLKEYGYDNGAFYEALRQRGFAVNANARANYPRTFQSLASTQNSAYLYDFARILGPDTGQQQAVLESLEDSRAQRIMRGMGYYFFNSGFWWEATRLNRNADENFTGNSFSSGGISELERATLMMTPLPRLTEIIRGEGRDARSFSEQQCQYIRSKFEKLGNIGNGPKPVYAFVHFAIPHAPILMDAAGNCRHAKVNYQISEDSENSSNWNGFKEAYIEYLQYFNGRILDVIDRQLVARGVNGRRLVIVIQADEGPLPKSMRDDMKGFSFFDFEDSELRMKLGIINAVRLPDLSPEALQTPINNWRLILNHISSEDIPPLPHRTYIYRDEGHIYDFRDVTGLFHSERPPGRNP